MSGRAVSRVEGTAVVVPGHDIDTDRVIPARFLRSITFDDLGGQLFRDERVGPDGASLGHPIDHPDRAGANIMVSGRNFGCGSSREHAPQAIRRAGFDAVIAGSFAGIFFANSVALGLICVALEPEDLVAVTAAVEAEPRAPVVVTVAGAVTVGTLTVQGSVPAAAHRALSEGWWDPLDNLRGNLDAVRALDASLPYTAWRPPG